MTYEELVERIEELEEENDMLQDEIDYLQGKISDLEWDNEVLSGTVDERVDMDDFAWELKHNNLMTDELERFIDDYMRFLS